MVNMLYSKEKRVFSSVLEAVGQTPLIRMSNIFPNRNVFLKAEFMNPGGSIKDRIGVYMIQEAEKKGIIKPGTTIVEPTSGNTGVGLALAAAIKGYKMVFTIPDKMAPEKGAALEAFGAEVIWCPTAVEPEDPRSYYSVAQQIAKERNGWVPNQYENLDNPQAHYVSTGPEIWEQTQGKITHFISSMGTGGTITGVGKFLKEKNPDIKIIGADAEGSIIKEAFENPDRSYDPSHIHTYKMEGIGEDFIPDTLDLSVVDEIYTIDDKTGFLVTRETVRKEGLMIGGSGGATVHTAKLVADKASEDAIIVVIVPDGSRPYLNKLFSDTWMKENSFL
jgi:cystathionine beta-synthase